MSRKEIKKSQKICHNKSIKGKSRSSEWLNNQQNYIRISTPLLPSQLLYPNKCNIHLALVFHILSLVFYDCFSRSLRLPLKKTLFPGSWWPFCGLAVNHPLLLWLKNNTRVRVGFCLAVPARLLPAVLTVTQQKEEEKGGGERLTSGRPWRAQFTPRWTGDRTCGYIAKYITLSTMAYTASVLPLQWPGLPYGAFKLQEDANLRRGKKRSLEDEDDLGRDSPSSFFSDEEQRVPEEKCIVSLQEQIVPNSELTFSNLMKRMAAKYQKRSSPTYVHAGSVQQADVLSQPFYSSQLLAAMAQVHQPMKRCRLEEPRPLDLSPRGEDRPQSPGQEIVDVVSICPEAQQQAYNMLPLTSWSISQVSQFIGSLDNCSEYAKVSKHCNTSWIKYRKELSLNLVNEPTMYKYFTSSRCEVMAVGDPSQQRLPNPQFR